MIQDTVNIDSHVPDEDLLRFIDGECDDVERQRITRHLGVCDPCSELHGSLLRTSHDLEDLLVSLDESPQPDLRQSVLDTANAVASLDTESTDRPRRVWLRFAAAVAGLIAVSLTAPGVRAWIVDQFAPVAEWFGGAEAPSPQEVIPAAPDRTSSTVSFRPTASVVQVYVESPQEQGVLTVDVHDAGNASAQITGTRGESSILVTPNGFRIRNLPRSGADYLVEVPLSVTEVHVRIGGAGLIVLPVADIAVDGRVMVGLR